jgi:hypothetical protein
LFAAFKKNFVAKAQPSAAGYQTSRQPAAKTLQTAKLAQSCLSGRTSQTRLQSQPFGQRRESEAQVEFVSATHYPL